MAKTRADVLKIDSETARAAVLNAAEMRLVSPAAAEMLIAFIRQHDELVALYDQAVETKELYIEMSRREIAADLLRSAKAKTTQERADRLEAARREDDVRIVRLLAEIAELRSPLSAKPAAQKARKRTKRADAPPPPARASRTAPSSLAFRGMRGQA